MGVSFVRLASARRTALAMGLCAALTAAAGAAPPRSKNLHQTGNLVPVTTCADDGSAGTLRKAIEGAADGDTIDMSELQCSLITLQSGALVTSLPNLAIQGPGIDALTIDGGNADRVLQGMTLDVSDLTIAHGVSLSYTGGGCIRTNGDLSLTRTRVTACLNASTSAAGGGSAFVLGNLTMRESMLLGNKASGVTFGEGGGAFVVGAATLYSSSISGNTAQAGQDTALGGGLMALTGNVTLHASNIDGNTATSSGARSYGGGIHAQGGGYVLILDASTVSGNIAHSESDSAYGGGINSGAYGYAVPTKVRVEHSTISGNAVESNCAGACLVSGGGVHAFDNVAAKYSTIDDNHALCNDDMSACAATGGGLASFGAQTGVSISLYNSTVSANSAVGGTQPNAFGAGGGMHVGSDKDFVADNSTIAFNHACTAGGGISASSPAMASSKMSSTIVASNDTDNGVNDISIPPLANSVTVDGSNNLVMNWTGAVTLPVDTLTGDPALLQLTTDDGGLTATHPLSAGSVAIDAGSNPDVLGCDQRGYPYHRVQGSAADIGAYEAQGERHLFADGFDGSADCPSAAP